MSKLADIRVKYQDKSAEFKISVISSVCTKCRNFDVSNPIARQCAAFPAGIPLEIWKGENNHSSAYPGDGGIRFQAIEFKRAA